MESSVIYYIFIAIDSGHTYSIIFSAYPLVSQIDANEFRNVCVEKKKNERHPLQIYLINVHVNSMYECFFNECILNPLSESHVSFEFAMLYDQLYQYTMAGVMFIVSLDLLKPLTFNSHLHILYFSLTNGRKEILSFVSLFMIVISAFASYMHITTGYLVHQFRNPFSAILSMMQIVLSMISLRKHAEISTLHAQISISVFAFIMIFIFVNFFIAMLSFYFSDGKENFLTSSKFMKELNDHLWCRIHHLCSEVWRTMTCLSPQSSGKMFYTL